MGGASDGREAWPCGFGPATTEGDIQSLIERGHRARAEALANHDGDRGDRAARSPRSWPRGTHRGRHPRRDIVTLCPAGTVEARNTSRRPRLAGRRTAPGNRPGREGPGRASDGYSSRKCSTSIAAMQPVPAAVIAWRYTGSIESPQANTPEMLVRVEPGCTFK